MVGAAASEGWRGDGGEGGGGHLRAAPQRTAGSTGIPREAFEAGEVSVFVCIHGPKMGPTSVVVVIVVLAGQRSGRKQCASVLRPGDGTVAAVLRRELS